MAELSYNDLLTFAAGYVLKAKQAGTWSDTRDNFVGLLDKIGKQVTLDGNYEDKLPELSGDNLPLGKTIEEFFIDLTQASSFVEPTSMTPGDTLSPNIPAVEEVTYSKTLGRKFVKTTVLYDNFERACCDSETAGTIAAKVTERLQQSVAMHRYAEKKQLIGNACDKAVAAGNVKVIAVPTSDTTGEAFIQQIKSDVEAASFAHQHTYLKNDGVTTDSVFIGSAPSLTLYVKKGVMPVLEVQTLSGSFNRDELALPCKVKVIDDFGTMTNTGVYAVLVDDRAIRLHSAYQAVRSQENAQGDFVNIINHWEDVGFISKYAFIKAYKPS